MERGRREENCGRRVVDELPLHVRVLPGEIDLVFQLFAADLDVLLNDFDVDDMDMERNNHGR